MNRESERKRLVELLKHECDVDDRYDGEGNCPGCKYNGMEDCSLQELADHLLNNGISREEAEKMLKGEGK